ncbi:unnamed protein product [Ectocarpus sp. CCAP 1310/34]|nr:unnamed protein product [Ectocarpus sp. CCAP 1310/34]
MTGKWAFVNMKPQQKFLLSPVAKQYRVVTLLSNWHSCMNGGNEISQYSILWRGATHFRGVRSGVSARCTHVV